MTIETELNAVSMVTKRQLSSVTRICCMLGILVTLSSMLIGCSKSFDISGRVFDQEAGRVSPNTKVIVSAWTKGWVIVPIGGVRKFGTLTNKSGTFRLVGSVVNDNAFGWLDALIGPNIYRIDVEACSLDGNYDEMRDIKDPFISIGLKTQTNPMKEDAWRQFRTCGRVFESEHSIRWQPTLPVPSEHQTCAENSDCVRMYLSCIPCDDCGTLINKNFEDIYQSRNELCSEVQTQTRCDGWCIERISCRDGRCNQTAPEECINGVLPNH